MGTTEAPGAAALVEDFCNSVDLEDGPDAFADIGGYSSWLSARALLHPAEPVSESDRRTAVELREALRDVIEQSTHDGSADTGALDALAARLPLRLSFAGGAPALRPATSGPDGALAGVLAAAAQSVADGTWGRLKVCPRDSCRWVFYDASRNRSRHWCSMTSCGNKEKTRSYRERRRHAPAG
jgi:predicted RNA-binding Zn ribbon-like protein